MASSKSGPSQNPIPSTARNPSTVVEIEEITNAIHCIALTDEDKPCQNPIGKEDHIRAEEILLSIAATSPSSSTLDSEFAELRAILLRYRHRADPEKVKELKEEWTRLEQALADLSNWMKAEMSRFDGEADADSGLEERGEKGTG